MKKSLLFLSALVAGALTLLFADDHREREKERERDEPRREVREKQERKITRRGRPSGIGEIHEASESQVNSPMIEGREKRSRLLTENITSMKKKGSGKEWRKRLKEPSVLVV